MWTVDWSLADGRVLIEGPIVVVTLVPLRWQRRLAVIPALVGLYAAYVSRPAPPYWDDALAHWLPVALLPLLLLLRKRIRIAVSAVAVSAFIATMVWTSLLPERVGHGGHHHGVSVAQLTGVRIVNRSHQNHPMHLHGHTLLVLSRDGRPTTGSPWWTDSLDVRPGEIFEVAFRAGNPGVWMDHCHNLDPAANGMVMHLVYDGYTSPHESGHATNNHPE